MMLDIENRLSVTHNKYNQGMKEIENQKKEINTYIDTQVIQYDNYIMTELINIDRIKQEREFLMKQSLLISFMSN